LRDLLRDKRYIYFIAGLVVIVIAGTLGLRQLSAERRELKLLQEQRKEMLGLKEEFLSLRQRVTAVEGKKNLTNVQGVVQAVEDVFSSAGLKDKLKTIRSSGKREVKDGFEEEADISIEKVSMNEMVNIFYRIENAPMILTIKKATIKKSFENPELLNISLVLSFLKPK
jgi:general secretion pathway protein M